MISLPFLHSPARILAALLLAKGWAGDPTTWSLESTQDGDAWPAFTDSEPDRPDNCITVYDTAEVKDGRAQVSGETFQRYGVQVRVRATGHDVGYAKTDWLRRHLNEDIYQAGITLTAGGNTARYTVWAVSRTNLFRLGRDLPRTKRSLFTINGVVSIIRES